MNLLTKLGEFLEGPNDRSDLKQPAGAFCVYTLCHVALFGIPISQPLCWALLVIGLAWYLGDATALTNVIKAAAGGFRVPDITTQVQGDIVAPVTGDSPTIVQTPTPTPTTTQD